MSFIYFFILLQFLLFSNTILEESCAQQGSVSKKTIMDGLLQHISPSGETINELMFKRSDISAGSASYGKPECTIETGQNNDAIISCVQNVAFYTDEKDTPMDGAEIMRWYFDGNSYFSIMPNGLEDGLEDIEMPTL